jgi:hypothetical protein
MTEEQLEQLAARLGSDAVGNLDSERLAQAVFARLAAQPAPVLPLRRVRRGLLVALAAAAALLLVSRLTLQQAPAPAELPGSGGTALSVLHELDDLSVSELEILLETLPPLAAEAAHPDPAPIDEMDTKSLERLLRSLEG